jgi:hypothetical protein
MRSNERWICGNDWGIDDLDLWGDAVLKRCARKRYKREESAKPTLASIPTGAQRIEHEAPPPPEIYSRVRIL